MEVILLERVAKLGQMGEIVNVRPGYARNFLLARGKALRATEGNKAVFDKQKAQLETRNLAARADAQKVAESLDGVSVVLIRQAGESGVLYGSVATRDIADVLTNNGFTVARSQITLQQPIKTLGLHAVPISLHAEVEVKVTVNVARSAEEADRQSMGETIMSDRDDGNLDDLGLEIGAALAEAGGDRDRDRDR
ncbi:MAG: 50S ribosomal protein L9 [Beijerinckiaceae bacterium]